MTSVPDDMRCGSLTPDEFRMVMERRAQAAIEAGPPAPPPTSPAITGQEWELLQLHRIAQQSRIVGSGLVANEPDPLQDRNAVTIVVLRSIRAEIPDERGEVFDLLDRWLGILGADGKQSGSASSGPGR